MYLTFTEAGPECFDVGITQDSLLEGTEYFYLVLATRDDDIIFDIRSAIVYIVDGNSMFRILAHDPFSSSTHPIYIYTASNLPILLFEKILSILLCIIN